ncbi:MAG: YajQ family cyclic di-GMP-binding protein [Thermodesulfobacteriota bacterium]
MPSFDVVSEVNMHEVSNAVDQANREVSTRFDFKGSGARYELNDAVVTMHGENDFHLQQMLPILQSKLSKRGIDLTCLKLNDPEISLKKARRDVTLRQGLDTPMAKQIVKIIKGAKLKVQAAIQDEKVRVSGKKRDDLQQVISLLKDANIDMPLQFINFRD